MRNARPANPVAVAAASLALCITGATVPAVLGADQSSSPPPQQQQQEGGGAASGDQNAPSSQAQAQVQAQAHPEIEKQRQDAQREGEQALDRDAATAIQETRNAIQAIDQNNIDQAIAALERANGKINILVGRNPATALPPVAVEVEVIDAAPTDKKEIRKIARAAERAVSDRDYPQARVLLANLTSELRVRTTHLPLAGYPAAMQEAARLLQQKNTAEARAVLETALHTLVVIDRVRPLPIVLAQAAVENAQQQKDKDRNAALQLLSTARAEVERAKELGYAGTDPEYDAVASAISDVEKQVKNNGDSGGAFSRLKERIAAMFKRQSDSEKSSETARR